MTYVVIWLVGSVCAFLALRHFALRDFGEITVGGLIGLTIYSLFAPAAAITAIILSLEGRGKFLGKTVWKRGR